MVFQVMFVFSHKRTFRAVSKKLSSLMFKHLDFLKNTYQLSIFSGLICILVCLQKSSLVTVTKSHCLHLNVLTFPCELILGTLMPVAKDLKHDCKMNTCNKKCIKIYLDHHPSPQESSYAHLSNGLCIQAQTWCKIHT